MTTNHSKTAKRPVKGRGGPQKAPQEHVREREPRPMTIYCANLAECLACLSPMAQQILLEFIRHRSADPDDEPGFVTVGIANMAAAASIGPEEIVRRIDEIGRLMLRTSAGAWMRLMCPVWISVDADGRAEDMVVFAPPMHMIDQEES